MADLGSGEVGGVPIPHNPLDSKGQQAVDAIDAGLSSVDPARGPSQRVITNQELEDLKLNALDGYLNVQYHLRLSLVRNPAGGTTHYWEDLVESDHVVFASTGDTGGAESLTANQYDTQAVAVAPDEGPIVFGQFETEEVQTSIDPGSESFDESSTESVQTVDESYFISQFNIRSIVSVTANNPELARAVEMKMTIMEPHGFSFDRVARRVAYQLGYGNDSVGRARAFWRIDVGFSGYEDASGTWVERIPFQNPYDNNQTVSEVTYFCHLISLETSVSVTGSEHQLHLIPFNDVAMRPEVMLAGAGTIQLSSIQTPFRDFVSQMGQQLTEAASRAVQDSDELVKFEIVLSEEADRMIGGSTYGEESNIIQAMGLTENPEDGLHWPLDDRTSVLREIRSAINALPEAQRLFATTPEINPNRTEPRVTFIVNPETIYDNAEIDGGTNDYRHVTYRYIIEPFYDFRYSYSSDDQITDATFRQTRVDRMVDLGLLRRHYSYMYTSENTEISNFDVRFKFYFYDDIPIELDAVSSNYHATSQEANKVQDDNRSKGEKTVGGSSAATKQDVPPHSPPNSTRATDSSDIGTLASFRRDTTTPLAPTRPTGAEALQIAYDTQFEQRITGDMISLDDLEVRGDPRWLLSKEYLPNAVRGRTTGTQVIRLDVFAPQQQDYMNSEIYKSEANPYADVSVGGFYEIIEVNHRFENGQFLQNLKGYRLRGL